MRLVDLLVADLDLVHLDVQILVIAQLEFRQHLENGAELQRLAFLELNVVHFRARHRNHLFLVERLLEIFRHERLHDFALDVFGEPAADQRDGRLPGTESRDAGDARDVARHLLGGLLNILRRNFQFDFALAGSFSVIKGVSQHEPWHRRFRIRLSPVRNPGIRRAGKLPKRCYRSTV